MTEPLDEPTEQDAAPLTGALGEAAAAYHAAGDLVPRNAMWAAIQARRAGQAGTAVSREVAGAGDGVLPLRRPDARDVAPTMRVPRWAYAAAATLVLTVGIGIGRQMRTNLVATRDAARSDSVSSAVVWREATTAHLGQAETLLAWVTSSKEARSEAQLTAWSRDLLESTRLLLDSPAGRDPRRRPLLLELELVLVQLVESGPTMDPNDRTMMDEMLSRSSLLLTRLRTTVPAGMPSAHD
jgi:hypothetical protein